MGAPTPCAYCDGHGEREDGNDCGFCETGKPLDTQEDWDRSWGEILSLHGHVILTDDDDKEEP